VLTDGGIWLLFPKMKNEAQSAAMIIRMINIMKAIFQKLVLFSIPVIKADFSQKNKFCSFSVLALTDVRVVGENRGFFV